jgi:hypothetical protein
MAEERIVDGDEVVPTEIEHKCEMLFVGDECEQIYNYITYHFDCDGVYFRARAYLDEIETVSVLGPFEDRHSVNRMSGPLNEGMLSYLKRRFRKIQTLGNDGYVDVCSDRRPTSSSRRSTETPA